MRRILFGLLIVLFHSYPAASGEPGDWRDPQRPFRVTVTVAKEKQPRERAFVVLPLDFAADLARLGVRATVDPQSLRLVRAGRGDVPCQVRDGRVEWADGPIAAGEDRSYHLYFGTNAQRAPAGSAGRWGWATPLLERICDVAGGISQQAAGDGGRRDEHGLGKDAHGD